MVHGSHHEILEGLSARVLNSRSRDCGFNMFLKGYPLEAKTAPKN